jgi:Predicted DNA alkylation repair enzyme
LINVKEELIKNSDPKLKERHLTTIPGAKNMYGVHVPILRDLAKRICKEDWQSFLKESSFSYEESMLRALVISGAKMSTEERLEWSRTFMPEITNWALCDIFCSEWDIKNQEKEKLWDYCLELIKTDDEFMMRVSAVMMLVHFIDDHYIDSVLHILSISYHEGYYFKMGSAWALSICFVKYPEKTEPYLFVPSLDNDIRNKAIQKICDSYRVEKEKKKELRIKKATLFPK